MFKIILGFLAIVTPLHLMVEGQNYYWKDFNGTLPEDALASNAETVYYIGQGLTNEGHILIGSLNNNSLNLLVHNNGTIFNLTTDIKILCSAEPEHFVWIPYPSEVKDNNTIRVFGGSRSNNGSYPFGNLVIGRSQWASTLGYHDVTDKLNYMYHVYLGYPYFSSPGQYDELYYVL